MDNQTENVQPTIQEQVNVDNNVQTTNSTQTNTSKEKKVTWILIIALVVIGVLVSIVIGFVAIFSILSSNSHKLVCKSKEGNITIMYTDKQITGYTAVGVTYDLDGQKAIAEKIGTDAYMKEFNHWFETHTTGTCTYEK